MKRLDRIAAGIVGGVGAFVEPEGSDSGRDRREAEKRLVVLAAQYRDKPLPALSAGALSILRRKP